ncbi:fatty-acid amide hydrolase 2-B-like [Colletes latitarsis]|uniref:fatty-acid amide hydrolase 2-B-like n=1 Tax=Colletes latitarsis TaxID=2605962 RepID=UPI0040353AF4
MFLFYLIVIVANVLRFILRPLFNYIHSNEPLRVPPITHPLLKVTATTLARRIRHGQLSSQTVVEVYIQRIKEVNPILNAVIEERFEAAINDAKICDENLKTGNVIPAILEREKPLYGVPVSIKESCALEGLSYTGGSLSRKGVKASKDGSAVELLKNAGAIPLCVTNTPEQCSGYHSANFLHGTTRNPYDTRKSAGGSSGGEGALIGAGASILGLGSDLLGSIRVPSLFNGIFGHKPTPGIIPNRGHIPDFKNTSLEYMFAYGPMARYTEDLYLAMRVLSFECETPLRLKEYVDLETLRVFYANNIDSNCCFGSTTSDIKQAIKTATCYLSQKGARVEQLSQEWVRDSILYVLFTFLADDVPQVLLDPKQPDKKTRASLENLKAMFGLSNFTIWPISFQLLVDNRGFCTPAEKDNITSLTDNMRQKINKLLGNDGVFILPTYPQATTVPELIFLQSFFNKYCAICNALQLPSTHVPMGLNNDGLPIGFQVIAASYQDRLCLAVARELEKAFGGWIPPTS